MLERPDMYAANPESLEDQLTLLDGLRKQLLNPDANSRDLMDEGYYAFLKSRDYGVANFCHRHRPGGPLAKRDRQLFPQLADFWKKYRQSRFFAHSPGPFPAVGPGRGENELREAGDELAGR